MKQIRGRDEGWDEDHKKWQHAKKIRETKAGIAFVCKRVCDVSQYGWMEGQKQNEAERRDGGMHVTCMIAHYFEQPTVSNYL